MSEQETWQDEDGNTHYQIDDGGEGAYAINDPDATSADSLSDDVDEDSFSSDESISDDEETDDGDQDLLGFPPGRTKADYVAINGGSPPFGEWRWPPDFTDEDKDTFWRGATQGGSDYAYMAAYNRVSAFNNPNAALTGKADTGMSVESFEQEASMYSYYNPSGVGADFDPDAMIAQDADNDAAADANAQPQAQAQAVDLTWNDVDWGFVQKVNERILKDTGAGGQQPFWQVGGGLLIGWEQPTSYRALFETLAGGGGGGDVPHGFIDVASRGSFGSRGEIQVTGSYDRDAFKRAIRQFSQKGIDFQ